MRRLYTMRPEFSLFDFADPQTVSSRRNQTIVAPQAALLAQQRVAARLGAAPGGEIARSGRPRGREGPRVRGLPGSFRTAALGGRVAVYSRSSRGLGAGTPGLPTVADRLEPTPW